MFLVWCELLEGTRCSFNNSFDGTIPEKIRKMKKLKVLDIGYNSFGGPLPSDLMNSQLPTILLLDNNELFDSISPEAGQRSYRNRRAITGNVICS